MQTETKCCEVSFIRRHLELFLAASPLPRQQYKYINNSACLFNLGFPGVGRGGHGTIPCSLSQYLSNIFCCLHLHISQMANVFCLRYFETTNCLFMFCICQMDLKYFLIPLYKFFISKNVTLFSNLQLKHEFIPFQFFLIKHGKLFNFVPSIFSFMALLLSHFFPKIKEVFLVLIHIKIVYYRSYDFITDFLIKLIFDLEKLCIILSHILMSNSM